MKLNVLTFMLILVLLPELSYGRCRTVGESASLGTAYGAFPLYPAKRVIANGEKRDNVALQWVGYGIGLPLFVVAMPFAMVGQEWAPRYILGRNVISMMMIGQD